MDQISRQLPRASLAVPTLGFGAAAIGNLYSVVADEVAEAAVREAYRLGIRFFDTAPYYGYGLSEQGLSRAAHVVRGYRLWRLFLSECADQVGAFGELDVEAVDERLPPGVVSALESRLLAEGRLPATEGERPRVRPS